MSSLPEALINEVSIIVVEGNEYVLKMLIEWFEFFLNRKIVSFDNSESALEYLQEKGNEVHVVISGVEMPGHLNGLAFLEKIIDLFPSIIPACMSGYDGNIPKAKAIGVKYYFRKPLCLGDMAQFVEDCISGKTPSIEKKSSKKV